MREQDAAKILLVRSLEESEESAFSPDMIADAFKDAGQNIGDASWFVKRADALLRHFPQWREVVLPLSQFPDNSPSWILVIAFFAGLATNYLGPPGKIHVLYNPIMALVTWNVFVYACIPLAWLIKSFRSSLLSEGGFRKAKTPTGEAPHGVPISAGVETPQTSKKVLSSPEVSRRGIDKKEIKLPWVLRLILKPLWECLIVRIMQHRERAAHVYSRSKIIGRFWTHWSRCAGSLILSRWKRLLHLGAASIALGAIAGMYLRGLIFDYHVIWTSTFIKEEATVAGLMKLFFGPAQFLSRLVGLDLEAGVHLAKLTSPGGDPAAAWIHLFSITAIVFVFVPRIGLALRCRARSRTLKEQVRVNFDEYFATVIQSQIGRTIRGEVRVVGAKFSEDVAAFVRDKLYGERIVPELRKFREKGGSLNGLKERIRQISEEFESELNSYKDTAVKEFEQSLGSRMERLAAGLATAFGMGRLAGENVLSVDRVAAKEIEQSIGVIGHSFTDAVSLAVSASVTVALGTIGGGFGNALGTAILTALFGTSGPVGFVIGAMVGLVVTGAGWWFGREKITQAIEGIEIPVAVVQTCLWTARFDVLVEEGRTKCHESVKKHISDLMEPLIPRIADEIWLRIRGPWKG